MTLKHESADFNYLIMTSSEYLIVTKVWSRCYIENQNHEIYYL